jgi:hypothetical protein
VIVSATTRSPVPREVQTELERVVRRWRQLPLGHALSYAERVRALVQSLADSVARAPGLPVRAVPDCGPATLMDQLAVMVYDVSAADLVPQVSPAEPSAAAGTSISTTTPTSTLARDLATLRRELR